MELRPPNILMEPTRHRPVIVSPRCAAHLARKVPINGRTLSRVTRRAGVRKRSGVERRATFDRAVWTKPLAFAADAVLSAMSFQSYGPHAPERA